MAVPAPPTNVTATVDSNSQITISWDYDPTWFAFDGSDDSLGGFDEGRWFSSSSVDNFEIEITRDAIGWVSPAGGSTTVTHDGSTSYSATYNPASDADYGKQVGIDSMFKFRVRATNVDGGSDWGVSGKAYTQPIPPKNPSVNRPNSTTIEVNWTVETDVYYQTQVYVREDTGSGYGNWGLIEAVFDESGSVTLDGSSNNYSFSGIAEDARYQIRLRHRNDNGSYNIDSKWVYADYGNNGNVYFSDDFETGDVSAWDSTYNSNYSVQGGTHGDAGISGPDEGSYYLAGMGQNSTEATWVQKNLGDLSAENDVLVKCTFAVGSLDTNSENFNIEWYDGSSWQVLGDWNYEYNEQGWYEVSLLVPDSWLSTDNRIRVGDTTSSGMYGGDHFAVDRVVVSDILHEYTKPAAPTNPTTDESVEDELTLDWTDNTSLSDGHPEWFHRVYGSGSSFTKEFDNPPHTWTGLNDGERYEWYPSVVYYQPRNGGGDQGGTDTWWRADGPTTTGTTILPSPSIDSITTASDTSLDASWTDHADNEDGFEVYYRESGTSTWNKFSDLGANTTTEAITGLSQDTTYEVRVDDYTEHVTSQSGTSTSTTNLNESRSTSSYSSSITASTIRVITLSESVSSYAATSGSSSIRVVALIEDVSSYSTPISVVSGTVIDLFQGVTSSTTTIESSSIRVVDFFESVSSHAAASDSGAIRVVTLLGDVSSYLSPASSSSKRVVALLEGVTSSANASNSSTSTVIDLSFAVDSHSTSASSEVDSLINLFATTLSESSVMDSSSKRVVTLLEGVISSANASSSSISTVVDLNNAVGSHSTSASSEVESLISLLATTLSKSNTMDSTTTRGAINFEGRDSDVSYSSPSNSGAIRIVDLLESTSSYSSISSAGSNRSQVDYADRLPDSFSDTLIADSIGVIDVSYGIESHSESSRSSVYNDRTSLELLDHELFWDEENSVWYTGWFFENKITGNEDEMAVRSLVIEDAKEPAAIVTIQYDDSGNGTVDEESDPINLGRNQSVLDVEGIPIDEDGKYRIKIMEYSGYNSLYALDTAIVH